MTGHKIIIFYLLLTPLALSAAVYHVRPDGDNRNSGFHNTPSAAWRTMDRGQPTVLTKKTSNGQSVIYVKRSCHLPDSGQIKIANTIVSYSGKGPGSLTGCKNTPAAAAGTTVHSVSTPPPQPGDTVIVHAGVYRAEPATNQATAYIASGGTSGQPLTFQGQGQPILDGCNNTKALWLNTAANIKLSGFTIRRGGILITHSQNIELNDNHIHSGRRGIFARYSRNVSIAGNKLYNFRGAWSNSPIVLGSGQNYHIVQNTIALTDHAGIRIFDQTGADFIIKNNIITRCRGGGISAGKQVNLTPANIGNNCLWNIGKVTWLHNIKRQQEGNNYYQGLAFTPGDIHQDPEIISFDPENKHFLDIATTSPCAKAKPMIGAGQSTFWPVTQNWIGMNRIINGSFDAGWYNWQASAWQSFDKGEVNWQIVTKPNQNGHSCLRIDNYPTDSEKQPAIKSSFFKIDRGYPVYVQFMAKAKALKPGRKIAMDIALNVPSWHNGSDAAKKRVHVSAHWQAYRLELPAAAAYYPNTVALKFAPRGNGTFWIDEINLWQHKPILSKQPSIALTSQLPGGLIAPESKLDFSISNPTETSYSLHLVPVFKSATGSLTKEEQQLISLPPGSQKTIEVAIPKAVTGGTLLQLNMYSSNELIQSKSYRLLVGTPVADNRNRDFFGINPKPGFRNPADLTNAAAMYKTAYNLGLGGFHHYLNIEQMQQLTTNNWAKDLVASARKAGINWLWTLQNHKLFTGKRTHIPAPGDLGEMATGQAIIQKDKQRLTPEQFAAWQKWLTVLCQQFGDQVRYWEICNEPNCYLTADEYLKILDFSAPIIRSQAPEAKLVGGSLVNAFNTAMWRDVINKGHGKYDYFSYHPYRFGLRDPLQGGFVKHLKQTRKELKEAANNAQIMLTEEYRKTGPVYFDRFTDLERWEANCFARMNIRALAAGVKANYHHHGLFADWNLTPDLCLNVIHTIASTLGNATVVKTTTITPDITACQFKVARDRNWLSWLTGTDYYSVLAIWHHDSEHAGNHPLTVNTTSTNYIIYNTFGNIINTKRNTFTLNNDLLFIVLPDRSPDQIGKINNVISTSKD